MHYHAAGCRSLPSSFCCHCAGFSSPAPVPAGCAAHRPSVSTPSPVASMVDRSRSAHDDPRFHGVRQAALFAGVRAPVQHKPERRICWPAYHRYSESTSCRGLADNVADDCWHCSLHPPARCNPAHQHAPGNRSRRPSASTLLNRFCPTAQSRRHRAAFAANGRCRYQWPRDVCHPNHL